jgi:hypothetical protein
MAGIQNALSGMQKSMAEFKKEQDATSKPGRRASIKVSESFVFESMRRG